MTEFENNRAPEAKRLVLGFDAGCVTCSELARRIEEQVGDKLEVRSLRDPQVQEWRKSALGENAPWIPTLIEIKGLRVRAWTGRSMGLALGRSLGPVRMWRVMQVLGEMDVSPVVEGSTVVEKPPAKAAEVVVDMSRAQFLKGVGGAAVAMSVLSGIGVFPSVAVARGSKGTTAERNSAKKIVRSSKQLKDLEHDQEQEVGKPGDGQDSWFDFDKAKVGVNKRKNAYVGVQTRDNDKRGVLALFAVNLNEGTVVSYHQVFARTDDGKRISVTHFKDGKPEQPYHRVFLEREGKKTYVVTEDDQKMSPRQFRGELKHAAQDQRQASPQQQATTQEFSSCEDCTNAEELSCIETADALCAGLGFASLFSGPFAITLGAAVIVSCGILDFVWCPGQAESTCTNEGFC